MSQAQGSLPREGAAEEALEALVDAVAGHLGGQREVDAVVGAGCDELLRHEEGGLGLPAAHRTFNNQRPRRPPQFGGRRLQAVGLEAHVVSRRERFGKAGCLERTAWPADVGQRAVSLATGRRR